jgi:hypothetical protein
MFSVSSPDPGWRTENVHISRNEKKEMLKLFQKFTGNSLLILSKLKCMILVNRVYALIKKYTHSKILY